MPRGRVHRGYGGGIDEPTGPQPDQLRAAYEAGDSIRTLADDTGLSIRRIRDLLAESDTPSSTSPSVPRR
ncbi:helix-turn-helix domain-containing protein [Tersicoccus phoenicis]|uniref:helix-turn-helix domain-containing protein n=1 Tax=Tersicoccus phoenicis TaxID=554083 RepID=UPI0038B41BC5